MRRWAGRAVGSLALAILAACSVTLGGGTSPTVTLASPTPEPSASPVATGPGSAAAAMRALCVAPKLGSHEPAPVVDTPDAIAEVEREVEAVRDLTYEHPVAVDPITSAQMSSKVAKSFDATYPAALYDRRTLAWRAMGVIGPEADIREALLAFQTGQVVGFYDPETGQLVYIGDTQLDLNERFILAHELTHAMDDQHFDLKRLDPVAAHCLDERFEAALGAIEGSAQYFATQVILRFPSGDLPSGGSQPSLEGIPPFMVALELFPYTDGQAFMTAMAVRDGTDGIDQALRSFPVSTEQILHPERYPSDRPQPLDIADLSARLGTGWNDLDVMQVGEEFLREMLRLRLDSGEADAAAAGWDGGLYRAWSDGTHMAVVLSTVWDTPDDATAFAQAARDWLDAGDTPGDVVGPNGNRVSLVFSDDPAALGVLRAHA